MSQISVNAKESQPKSTAAGKLTAAATIYSAAKLHSLAKSNEALLNAQKKSNEILSYMDAELVKLNNATVKLESIQNASLSELKKKNERDRIRDEIEDYRYQLDELRRQKKEADQIELQRCKDAVHSLNREVQLLGESQYSNVEKVILLDAMYDSILEFSATQFTEISDKQYLNDTEDLVKLTRTQLVDKFSELEHSDYEFIVNFPAKKITEIVEQLDSSQKSLQQRIKDYIKLKKHIEDNLSFNSAQLKKAKQLLAKLGVSL